MAINGSLWVYGTDLHLYGTDGNHWIYTGALVSNPAGAIAGSVWMDTQDNCVRYIDQSGGMRTINNTVAVGTVSAVIGSAFINTNWLYWVDNSKTLRYGHADVSAYSNVRPYSNIAHSDSPYQNVAHSDQPYANFAGPYSNTPYNNYNAYCDVTGWSASHGDIPHSDGSSYYNHAHGDVPAVNNPHSDSPAYNNAGYTNYQPHQDQPVRGA